MNHCSCSNAGKTPFWGACLLVILAAAGAAAADIGVAIPANSALRLVARIPVPQMTGTWDHLAADGVSARLFLSAQDEHAVDVIDLRTLRPIRRITGFFNRPQGELYVSGLNELVVTNGRDGTARIISGDTYELTHTIQLSMGADMIEYDPQTKLLYIESGGTDSNRGPGSVSIIEAASGQLAGSINTGFRAAAMSMERLRPRLYVAIPAANQIAVVDTSTRRIANRIDVPGRPASMALDEANHRLFVATRTFANDPRPPTFNVMDTETGRQITSLESKDGTESMFFDAAYRRIYTTGLEGYVQAYQQIGAKDYKLIATIPTASHAGTAQFIPEINRLCVALPPHDNQAAEVWVFEPVP